MIFIDYSNNGDNYSNSNSNSYINNNNNSDDS